MKFRKLLLLQLLIISTACYSQGLNLDFEHVIGSRLINWNFGPPDLDLNKLTISPDSIIKREGKYSLKLNNYENGEYRSAYQQIPAGYSGKNIVIKGYMKTEGVTKGFAGLFLAGTSKSKPLFADNMYDRSLKGTNDWTPVSIRLPYNEGADTINFGAVLVGPGTFWIDDLHLEIDGQSIEQAVKKKKYNAELDSVYNTKSGITITPTEDNCKALIAVCQIWGFLKYHFPIISSGEINWDAELFRVLPSVINKSKNEWLNAIENWVDQYKIPNTCKYCSPDSLKIEFQAQANYGDLFVPGYLSESLRKKLYYIKQNINFYYNYYIDFDKSTGNPLFQNENRYANSNYPDDGLRVLAVFRYWNAIQYFYPYRYQLGDNWNKDLHELLQIFLRAKNSTEYMLACLKMICKIKDSHASIAGYNEDYREFIGNKFPPFSIAIVENQILIDKVTTKLGINEKLMHGDIITEINGKSSDKYVSEILPLIPGSTIGAKMRDIAKIAMRGSEKEFSITISRKNKIFKFVIPRFSEMDLIFESTKTKEAEKSYKIISNDIGYIDGGNFNGIELSEMTNLFKKTSGLVIDMRKYPREFTPYTLGNYIKSEQSPFVKITNTDINFPGYFRFIKTLENGKSSYNSYKNNIIIIVNENTQSRGEFITMAFQSAPNVKVLGSQTAGSDGNVSRISLPGDIDTWISGIGIFYPDNTETQGKGIKIDYIMAPTINGFIKGRDELLDRAIMLLKNK